MPAGQAVSRFGSGIFFFFVVVTNLHINLFIKLSPLLEGMYCSDCLQQKRPNENLLLARISRGREPPHHYLCDVLLTSFRLNYTFFKNKINHFEAQMGRITSKKPLTVKTVDIGEFLVKESCFV